MFHSVLNDSRTVPHIITSSIEHDSVLKPLKELKHKGLIGEILLELIIIIIIIIIRINLC